MDGFAHAETDSRKLDRVDGSGGEKLSLADETDAVLSNGVKAEVKGRGLAPPTGGEEGAGLAG